MAERRTHDLLIVGGGIHGAAVARDAALRGLDVALVEKGDLASGTSSRTSKLIHGGIRYLETAQLGLVREALRERAVLLDTAPGFVRPLPFLIPHYRGAGRSPLRVSVGLALYGALAGRRRVGAAHRLGRTEALAVEPGLSPEGLTGGSLFSDAQMDDALLCVAIAGDAARAGASVHTHAELTSLAREGDRWRARFVGARDPEGNPLAQDGELTARRVVNAAGPWVDRVRALASSHGGSGDAGRDRGLASSMRRTRGTHVVLPDAAGTHALLLTAARDGRVLFVLPWGGHVLIGTTDVDDGVDPDRVAAAPEDIGYLRGEAARALPRTAGKAPARAFAGLRSLARRRAGRPSANPREYELLEEDEMISIVGGKYTTHRSLAERVVDRTVRALGRRAGPCVTARTPVAPERAARIDALATEHAGRVDLPGGLAIREAEVEHAARDERALQLDDLLFRRTRLWLDARALRAAAEPASRWMAARLGWSEGRRQAEVLRLRSGLDDEERRIEEGAR